MGPYARWLKRGADLALASAGLLVAAPILGAVAAGVAVKLGRPVLFRQRRAGRHAEPFSILKFRTMTDGRGPDGELLPDAQRMTDFGRWLRSTSLDELPELLNVLRGEMSLIGPRPLHLRYVPRYNGRQSRRHDVLPGITGLAQVRGRNALSWTERLELDVIYAQSVGFGLDLQILLETVLVTLRRQGITQEGQATMTEFRGEEGAIAGTARAKAA
ncbi:MAG: sugar transferase [Nannocystaceae bacterium]|nr:sugar transferase [Nannocystaceae bacterium]